MATRKTTTTNRSSSKTRRNTKPRVTDGHKTSSGKAMFRMFMGSRGGEFLVFSLITVLIILLNILFSRNRLDVFLIILGVELLVAFAVILLRLIAQQADLDR